jgi:hypothetical protein
MLATGLRGQWHISVFRFDVFSLQKIFLSLWQQQRRLDLWKRGLTVRDKLEFRARTKNCFCSWDAGNFFLQNSSNANRGKKLGFLLCGNITCRKFQQQWLFLAKKDKTRKQSYDRELQHHE